MTEYLAVGVAYIRSLVSLFHDPSRLGLFWWLSNLAIGFLMVLLGRGASDLISYLGDRAGRLGGAGAVIAWSFSLGFVVVALLWLIEPAFRPGVYYKESDVPEVEFATGFSLSLIAPQPLIFVLAYLFRGFTSFRRAGISGPPQ